MAGVKLHITLEDIEIDLLLEGIYQIFGDDFRGYERGPLKQKLQGVMQSTGLATISALQERVLHHESARNALLRALDFQQAGLFDNAGYLSVLREIIGPLLRSYANPRVWLPEVATTEEVFTLAILLAEEGLYDKTTIFATCANESLLRDAKEGSFAFEQLAGYEDNYRRCGGQHSLARYCIENNGKWVFVPSIRRNITWAQYSLATDTSFNEFHLIICRKPLSDFGAALRNRVLRLFNESLVRFGVLGLSGAGDFVNAPSLLHYKALSHEYGLYRRTD